MIESQLTAKLVEALNEQVLCDYRTRVAGGFSEPFYRAPSPDLPGEIQFNRDYLRSALHELAHWCAAGEARRKLDDYGYWYHPDGRSADQQREFFRVECLPQAIESRLCMALDIPFQVSCDNLAGNVSQREQQAFSASVRTKLNAMKALPLPDRIGKIVAVCESLSAK